MSKTEKNTKQEPTRRDVLAGGAVVAGAAIASSLPVSASAQVAGSDELKVGLIGCGGRGRGAASQTLSVGNCRLVAMGDVFEDRLEQGYKQLCAEQNKRSGQQDASGAPKNVTVTDKDKHIGFHAYEEVIAKSDLVVLATPPGWRPTHFEAAVEAGKHVFMEKPVAVDAPGIRKVLEAAKKADEKNLKVVVGLQRRYEDSYRTAYEKAITEGMIGRPIGAQVYWNGGGVWTRERQPNMSEMQYQMLNWYYFNWLCGDHIAEQHVHNLDVANWFLGALPVSAQGMGGREVRTSNKHGEIYDHHYVELTYPNGVITNSQCRHQPGCFNQIREEIQGTAGILNLRSGSAEIKDLDGKSLWRYRAPKTGVVNPYQAEHNHLHACIRSGEACNDAHYGATSTMCAVIGRYATYSGKQIKWDEAMAKGTDLLPEKWAWDADPKVMPNEDGSYPIAVPGVFDPYA